MPAGTDRRAVLTRELWLPLFPVGEYRANNGQWSKLEAAKLREMERNTRFLIRSGNLAKPPVGYQHPASSGEARGHIGDVKFENGVLHARIDQPKFIDDVKKGLRLEYSGEFAEEVDFVEHGVAKKCGPAVVGVAILGDQRPAIKNAQRRTLSDLVFGEGVTPVEAFEIKEELRKSGVVSHTYDAEGHYCFSEIAFDASVFAEENTTMTDAEIQALVTNTVNSATAPLKVENEALKTKLAAQETSFNERIQSFSESSVRKGDVKNFCEAVQKPNGKQNPRLTGPNVARLEKILLNPSVVKDKELDSDIRAFVEGIPPILVERGGGDGNGKGDSEGNGGGDKEEPKALADVRPKHFSDIRKFGEQITASVAAYFSEHPEQLKGIENNPAAQVAVVSDYVTKRDLTARS